MEYIYEKEGSLSKEVCEQIIHYFDNSSKKK